ncbi:MAG: MazG nucleotide pyrophosphohydrolase domain-containing protein [Solirubrobacterales bacterium]
MTRRLRRECPWDREQDERSIVPHTVEESYELAEAAHAGDDVRMLDELGDVLFQVYFLALLLEERGRGNLESVARSCVAKLVRRHPHVFGDRGDVQLEELPTDARTPSQVRRNWDEIKRREAGAADGASSGVTPGLPALLYARKLLKRAGDEVDPTAAVEKVQTAVDAAAECAGRAGAPAERASTHGSDRTYESLGELLFAVVKLSRALEVDPEIALRLHADRFRELAGAKPASG